MSCHCDHPKAELSKVPGTARYYHCASCGRTLRSRQVWMNPKALGTNPKPRHQPARKNPQQVRLPQLEARTAWQERAVTKQSVLTSPRKTDQRRSESKHDPRRVPCAPDVCD